MIALGAAPRYSLRPGRPGDQGYVTSTWLRSLQNAPGCRKVPRSSFYKAHGTDVDRLLDRPDVRIVVACDPADIDAILGWLCYTQMPPSMLALHYVYVRAEDRLGVELRRRGIARALLEAAREGLTRDTKLVYTYKGPSEKALLATHPATYVPVGRFL